jgi:hypothetical protein
MGESVGTRLLPFRRPVGGPQENIFASSLETVVGVAILQMNKIQGSNQSLHRERLPRDGIHDKLAVPKFTGHIH